MVRGDAIADSVDARVGTVRSCRNFRRSSRSLEGAEYLVRTMDVRGISLDACLLWSGMVVGNNELDRIRAEYRRRDADAERTSCYETSPGALFLRDSRDRAVLDALQAALTVPLNSVRLLDLGCGSGADLARFHDWGIPVSQLVGFDLLRERLVTARGRTLKAGLAQGNAGDLPFSDSSFDIVFQSMMFTSILDRDLRRRAASEIRRVLKPGGTILWYDFRWNPTNPATAGIRIAELGRLFPGWPITTRRVTLAPPLARAVAPITPGGARALDAIHSSGRIIWRSCAMARLSTCKTMLSFSPPLIGEEEINRWSLLRSGGSRAVRRHAASSRFASYPMPGGARSQLRHGGSSSGSCGAGISPGDEVITSTMTFADGARKQSGGGPG